VHALNILDDVLGDIKSGKAGELRGAMEMIGNSERGVLVLIRDPLKSSLSDRINASMGKQKKPSDDGSPNDSPDDSPGPELRDYGVGAQILLDLGVRDMIVLSNTERTLIGLDGFDLHVVEHRPIKALP